MCIGGARSIQHASQLWVALRSGLVIKQHGRLPVCAPGGERIGQRTDVTSRSLLHCAAASDHHAKQAKGAHTHTPPSKHMHVYVDTPPACGSVIGLERTRTTRKCPTRPSLAEQLLGRAARVI